MVYCGRKQGANERAGIANNTITLLSVHDNVIIGSR